MEDKYILALDIGTTTIRSFVYNSGADIVGSSVDKVILLSPRPGYIEIDPEVLWLSIVGVVQKSIQDAKLSVGQITAMGISTQRSTFITWSRKTGQAFHNFITWKDLRADHLVREWNDSCLWKLFKAGSYMMYLLLRIKRFRAGSVLKFMNSQTTLRLSWVLQNIEPLKAAVQIEDAMFGTMDTWLLYKLTDGALHVSDVSSASATGFFDPFTMQWAGWAMNLFRIPLQMLPKVVDTAGEHFTQTSPGIWGDAIPIRCCMADQTASMWGSCCFDSGDIKLTLGSGTFLNINTGSSPHASVSGLYPIVGWRLGQELIYSAEGSNSDTANIILWGQSLGLFTDPAESSVIANSVEDSGGVFFIPAFGGLGPPFSDGTAGSGFIGVCANTTQAHLVRALLESLAFNIAQLYRCVTTETSYEFRTISLDGGVSKNDFIAQLVSDLTGLRVQRPLDIEMSSRGCAHIVGVHLGIWRSKEELKSIQKPTQQFVPRDHVRKAYEPVMARWEEAAKRLCGWYAQSPRPSIVIATSTTSLKIPPEQDLNKSK